MSEISPTMRNTWRITFAIFWKMFFVIIFTGNIFIFMEYLVPAGQLRYQTIEAVSSLLNTMGLMAFLAPPGRIELVFSVVINILRYVFFFFVLAVLIRWHVGRKFGSVRLVIVSIE